MLRIGRLLIVIVVGVGVTRVSIVVIRLLFVARVGCWIVGRSVKRRSGIARRALLLLLRVWRTSALKMVVVVMTIGRSSFRIGPHGWRHGRIVV